MNSGRRTLAKLLSHVFIVISSSVVTDTNEWRRLKALFQVFSNVEDNMFIDQTGIIDQSGLKYPQIYMRAKESLHIPFKLQTFLPKTLPTNKQMSTNPFAREQTYSIIDKNYNEILQSKDIQVRTRTGRFSLFDRDESLGKVSC
jgi:hypothetical protein